MLHHFHKVFNTSWNSKQFNVLDVTLRDGGFRVDFNWNEQEIIEISTLLHKSGITYIELGYFGGLPELHKFTSSNIDIILTIEFIRELALTLPNCKLTLMVHPSALKSPINYLQLREAGIRLFRFVYHPDWHKKLLAEISTAHHAGASVSINFALASRYTIHELIQMIDEIYSTHHNLIDILFIADTCSNLHPLQVEQLFKLLKTRFDWKLGFHGHNSMQCAFINSLTAANNGAEFIDASINGIGRGAGNLNIRLLLINLIAQKVQQFDINQILKAENYLTQINKLNKHNDLLYEISGALNLTPVEEDHLIEYINDNKLDLNSTLLSQLSSYHNKQAK